MPQVEAVMLEATALRFTDVHVLPSTASFGGNLLVCLCKCYNLSPASQHLLQLYVGCNDTSLHSLLRENGSLHSQPQAAIKPADPSVADESTSTQSDL